MRITKKSFFILVLLACNILMQAQTVTLTVNMGNTVSQATNSHYGLNIETALDPDVAANANYKSSFASSGVKSVRYHGWNMVKQGTSQTWVNYSTQTWDTGRIATVLNNLSPYLTKAMINIPGAPGWLDLDNNEVPDPDKYVQYASFCASLVRIVNIQLGKNVQYWEPINEWDLDKFDAASMPTAANVYKMCYDSMKATDPTIKVGGGAFSQPWEDGQLNAYMSNVQGKLDFWSHHNYFTCTSTIPINDIYNESLLWGINNVRVRLSANGFNPSLPIYVDEYNIFWSYDCDTEYRMSSITGAIFDALNFKRVIEAGAAEGLMSWNDADGTFGKMKSFYDAPQYVGLRPGGELLKVLNTFGIGDVKLTSSSNTAKTDVFSVQAANGTAMFMLVNKDAGSTVSLSTTGWAAPAGSRNVTKIVIDNNGATQSSVIWSAVTAFQTLAANTITFFIIGNGNVVVTGTTVSPADASIPVGATQQLTAAIIPANANDQTITWSSSNASVATVNSTGLVTGAAAGTATITATTADGSFTATSAITVTTGGGGTTPIIKLTFNENTGTSVANTGSAGGTLTRTATTPAWSTNTPAGPGGTSSVDFGTTTGSFVVESGAAISQLGGLSSFTITGWINNRSSTTGDGGNRVISWINNGGDGVDLVYKSDGSLQLGIDEWPDASPAVSSASKITTSSTAAAANWRFFAVTYNSANNTVQYYFGTTAADATLDVTRTYNRGAVGTAIGSLAIGHFNTATRGVATDRMLRGLMDNVEVYGSVLTAAQVITAQARNSSNVAVTGVSVSPTSASRTVGQTVQLTATVSPANATNQAVSWGSSNTAVASVNSSGLVTANAVGTATITVTTADGGFTATSAITVTAANVPVTGVSVSPTSASIAVGATQQLTASISPANATNQGRTWSSSNTSVASVNSSGLVTANAVGTATITATTADGSFTATSAITVTTANVPVMGVSVSPTSASIAVGATQQLTATISPANATNQGRTWSSSNTSVVTVNSTGLVTGIKSGTATITAKTVDGNFIGTCIVIVSSVGIYPNPAAETVTVNMGQLTNATINVYDMTGTLLIRQNTNNNSIQILNLAKYSGQLVIKIIADKTTIARKVIVN